MNPTLETPNPFRRRPAHSNSLKLRALEAFEKRGWMNPPIWAVIVGFYPARASYSYLLRLYRFRLLRRQRSENGLILYNLSPRGKERLTWLRGSNGTRTDQEQRKEAVTG
jgi:hypothetical protein